ncbi:MAG: hypothetical protein NUW14_02485 [Deltaproteobacteria bacterium]|nr:hypothetical protein [Deltaproteobacteria bacterium]
MTRPIARVALLFGRPPRRGGRRNGRSSGHGDAIAAGGSHLWGTARSTHGENREARTMNRFGAFHTYSNG